MLSFFFSSRRRHTRLQGDWSSDVCSSDLRTTPDVPSASPDVPRVNPHAVVNARTLASPTAGSAARCRHPADENPWTLLPSSVNANVGFIIASPNSLALAKRSAGSFSSALAVAAATFADNDLRRAVTGY